MSSRFVEIYLQRRQKFNEQFDSFFKWLAESSFGIFSSAGEVIIFTIESVRSGLRKPYRFEELVRHMEFIGNQSVFIIIITGGFTGLALSYQIYLGFNLVNATNLVGPTVALGISRELGPVLTGLIVAARAGGAMAARIGTMRVSEQIDALEVMGVDPQQYLVAPRIFAALLVMPLLCAVFDFSAMLASHSLCINVLGLDPGVFWDKIQQWIEPRDINEGLFKATVFGFLFASVCCYKGFTTSGGARGVGDATNKGVVNSMVLIIVIDYVLTNIVRMIIEVTRNG